MSSEILAKIPVMFYVLLGRQMLTMFPRDGVQPEGQLMVTSPSDGLLFLPDEGV